MKAPIIEQPGLQSSVQKLLYALLTLLGWFVWCYLTWPFIGIVAHLLGVPMMGQSSFDAATSGLARQIVEVAYWCLIVIVVFFTFFALWISYHRLRFGNTVRRKQLLASEPSVAAATFGINPDVTVTLQQARRIVIHHEGGVIDRIELDSAQLKQGDLKRAA